MYRKNIHHDGFSKINSQQTALLGSFPTKLICLKAGDGLMRLTLPEAQAQIKTHTHQQINIHKDENTTDNKAIILVS